MKITVCNITNLGSVDEEFYLEMMLESALQFAHEIICVLNYPFENKKTKRYLTTKEKITQMKTDEFIKNHKHGKIKFFKLEFNENFGTAREFAHNKSTSDWNFFLDADEVVDDETVKNINMNIELVAEQKIDCIHVQYQHFIENFGKVDNSEPIHYGLYRLYKNYKGVKFPREVHSLPVYQWKGQSVLPNIIIWHLGYLRGMKKIYERFERNYRKPQIHLPYNQVNWRNWHYSGIYPTKDVNMDKIPKIIRNKFAMDIFDR